MKRQLFPQLLAWKNNPRRKPLILMGARQVGKTTLLQQFSKSCYEQMVYINFETEPQFSALFNQNLNPKDLIKAFELEKQIKIIPETTLIIFDEIQECPAALNALKYFCEDAREYSVCAAGSLLGVKLMHVKGFPVGKVDFLHLYPLSFLEFLNAIEQTQIVEYLTQLTSLEPLYATLHEKLLDYFKYYLIIGGMPEAVASYLCTDDLNQVRIVQNTILEAYQLDFFKHAPKEILMKLNIVWGAIPGQLAKENKKFIYSVLRKGARAKEFEDALQWLIEAGLVYKICNVTTPGIPLSGYAFFDFFKIYLLDVGLLGALSHVSPSTLLYGDTLFQEFKGALVENYVAQALTPHYDCYYWTSEGKAEIDFMIQDDRDILALEVKSGTNHRKKSLKVYIDQHQPRRALRASLMNLKQDGVILNCPLYLIGELPRLIILDRQ